MKNNKIIIYVLRIIIPIIIIILIGLFSISYTINNNKNYTDKIITNIKNNYSLTDKVLYINIYGNYYILTTKDKVIVLNKEYKEEYKEDINKIAKNINNYDLIYRKNKLIYEKTIITKNKIVYEYYDIKNYKKVSAKKMEI